MTYQVTIQPEAFQEIESSYRWLCDNWSPELASIWYNDLQDAIASLKSFPRRCPIAVEAAFFEREVRQLVMKKAGSWRILYVVQDDLISVLHVRHSRQSRSFESDE
jgi:plasmid stabilization system protein ParE